MLQQLLLSTHLTLQVVAHLHAAADLLVWSTEMRIPLLSLWQLLIDMNEEHLIHLTSAIHLPIISIPTFIPWGTIIPMVFRLLPWHITHRTPGAFRILDKLLLRQRIIIIILKALTTVHHHLLIGPATPAMPITALHRCLILRTTLCRLTTRTIHHATENRTCHPPCLTTLLQ